MYGHLQGALQKVYFYHLFSLNKNKSFSVAPTLQILFSSPCAVFTLLGKKREKEGRKKNLGQLTNRDVQVALHNDLFRNI